MKVFLNLLAGVVVLFILAMLFIPGEESKEASKRSMCFSNVKRRALALTMYTEDADERFPASQRWMDATAVYLKSKLGVNSNSLRCPAVFKIGFGYAFDGALSGKKLPSRPESVPMVYDSTSLGRNASDLVTSLPRPGRHEGKDNVAYSDGHAKGVAVP